MFLKCLCFFEVVEVFEAFEVVGVSDVFDVFDVFDVLPAGWLAEWIADRLAGWLLAGWRWILDPRTSQNNI